MGFDIGELVERAQVGEHTVTVPGIGIRGPRYRDVSKLEGIPGEHICGSNGFKDVPGAECSPCDYRKAAERALDKVYARFFPDQEKRASQ